MSDILILGGTRFIGLFTVRKLLESGKEVTIFTRGNREVPFNQENIQHIIGNRENTEDLRRVVEIADPDTIIDFISFRPEHIEDAFKLSNSFNNYIFISSTHTYDKSSHIPFTEDETPILDPVENSDKTYGEMKAEADRLLFNSAPESLNVVSVRPTVVYGPYDNTNRLKYWIHRIQNYERLLVPGERGIMPIHLCYVEDVAEAICSILKTTMAGEIYNVGSKYHFTFEKFVDIIASALETSVEVVHLCENELKETAISLDDFPYYTRQPYVISTEKIRRLGWKPTPFAHGIVETLADSEKDYTKQPERGPERKMEEEVLEQIS